MRVIPGGLYSWTRVGYARPLFPSEAVPFGYVVDGSVVVDVGKNDFRFTPAERAAGRAKVQRVRFPGYPIPILEDTTFLGTIFNQEKPHTAGLFAIAPGVRVVFEADSEHGPCGLVNVTIPDEVADADVGNVNNAQLVLAATGDPDQPTTALLHECETCASFHAALVEEIRSGKWDTHHRLGLVKAPGRVRRLNSGAADLLDHQAQNGAVLASFSAVKAAG